MKNIIISIALLNLLGSCQMDFGNFDKKDIQPYQSKGDKKCELTVKCEPQRYYYSDSITLTLENIEESNDLKVLLNKEKYLEYSKSDDIIRVKFRPTKIGINTIEISGSNLESTIIKNIDVSVPIVIFTPFNYYLKANTENILQYAANGIPQSELSFEVNNATFQFESGILKVKPALNSKIVSISVNHFDVNLYYHELPVR